MAVARSEKPLQDLKERFGDRVQVLVGDIAESWVAPKAVEIAVEKYGQLDSVVANAGVLDPVDAVAKADVAKWKTLFDINFFSVVELVQAALPELRKTKGKVLAVLSGASTTAYYGWGAYGASKAALNHFISTVAEENPDVQAISIAPGVVATEMQKDIREVFGKNMTPQSLQKFLDLHKNDQLVAPEEPATVFANLATKEWSEGLNGKYLRYSDSSLSAYGK